MIFFTLFALVSGLQGITEALSVENCGGIGVLESVQVTGCNYSPCTFERGRSYSLYVTMIPRGASSSLKYAATTNIFGNKIPIMSGNACELLIGSQRCPVRGGARIRLKFNVRIPKNVPQIPKLVISANIVDEYQNVQVCAGLSAKIV